MRKWEKAIAYFKRKLSKKKSKSNRKKEKKQKLLCVFIFLISLYSLHVYIWCKLFLNSWDFFAHKWWIIFHDNFCKTILKKCITIIKKCIFQLKILSLKFFKSHKKNWKPQKMGLFVCYNCEEIESFLNSIYYCHSF